MADPFVHLHVASGYSLQYGASPPHVLVVPRAHYPNAAALAAGEPGVAAALFDAAGQIAAQEGQASGARATIIDASGKGAGLLAEPVLHLAVGDDERLLSQPRAQ